MKAKKVSIYQYFSLFLLLILGVGCGLNPESPAPDENHDGLPPGSFANLQRKVFNLHCALAGCHNTVSKAGGLVLETSVSYANVVNVPPTNTAARAAGYKLIRPSRADSSFLYIKTNATLSGEFGGRMPLNSTNGLTSSAREFIRQWIAAGAPYSGDVADVRLLSEPVVVGDPFTPLALPERGIQLHLRPFAIDPGKEREIFV